MKLFTLTTALLTTLLFSSCKKDHTCFCNDPRADVKGFTIHDTKQNAKEKCEATKNPFNDSKCELAD